MPKPDKSNFRLINGVTWEQLADGRTHRLKRGKHFEGDVNASKDAAKEVAAELRKEVEVVRDPIGKLHYAWVQFTDGRISLGQPCPCGSRRLIRVHEKYVRCPECDSLLTIDGVAPGYNRAGELVSESEAASGVRAGGPPPRRRGRYELRDFTDVRLSHHRTVDGKEIHRGVGRHHVVGDMLLIVRYRLDPDGERIPDPDRGGEDSYTMDAFPVEPFAEALDLDRL